MSSLQDSLTLEVLEQDPDPILARLREEAPVVFSSSMNLWLVTRWDDVEFMDLHPELFTAATEPSFLRRALGVNMLTLDAPEAARLKTAMMPPFQRSGASGEFAETTLPALCDELIDGFVDDGHADIVSPYAAAVSAASLKIVLGLTDTTWQQVWTWCEGLCADIANFENDPAKTAQGAAAKQELEEALDTKLDELRGPRKDRRLDFGGRTTGTALGHMLAVDASGRPLTRDEIINNVRLMVSGGINEPRDGIGLATWVLLEDPALREEVESDRKLWRRLVDEVMRLFSPVGTITRQTTADVELGGTTIPKGQLVAGVLRSANLDERRFNDPMKLDLRRTEGGHAAFALGQHRCLGEWLGRQEVAVGTERLFARLPHLRLDGDVELHGFEFRGPKALRVRWDVEGA